MRKILYCCITILVIGCKEKYEPPVSSPATGYLVVEGYISANGPAEIHLSRTVPLDSIKITSESLAKVMVQGRDNNSSYTLTESTKGVYSNNLLNLNSSQQYRLYVKTKDGKEYASDYVNVKFAPFIDSISWTRENNGVQLYANTHDPQSNTRYYRWETEETWEFHSRYYSVLTFSHDSRGNINGVQYRRPDHEPELTIYTCWQSENSTNILLGSSAKLSEDIMHQPLVFIPPASWKLSVLYSINVKQYALSKEEYEYLSKMKSNTEETGSIFDKQPSELQGNIHCLTKPDEPVIGFIGIANVQVQRIFIKNSDVPDWRYNPDCYDQIIPVDSAYFYPSLLPTIPYAFTPTGAISYYTGARGDCVDCTTIGTNTKPSFWP